MVLSLVWHVAMFGYSLFLILFAGFLWWQHDFTSFRAFPLVKTTWWNQVKTPLNNHCGKPVSNVPCFIIVLPLVSQVAPSLTSLWLHLLTTSKAGQDRVPIYRMPRCRFHLPIYSASCCCKSSVLLPPSFPKAICAGGTRLSIQAFCWLAFRKKWSSVCCYHEQGVISTYYSLWASYPAPWLLIQPYTIWAVFLLLGMILKHVCSYINKILPHHRVHAHF